MTDSGENTTSDQVHHALWVGQEECKIRLFGLSKSCWTKDVYEALKLYGNITRIEMQKRTSENQAWVTFQPPPSTPIPSRIPDVKGTAVRWEQHRTLARSMTSYSHYTRIHHDQSILFADSITFGVRSSDHSMVAMRTVDDSNAVQLMLDVERKVLEVRFKFLLGDRPRRFMFRMSIARLSCIHRLAEADNQTDLIIPYDKPPHFFIQREEGEKLTNGKTHKSFSSKEEFWNDRGSWYRITTLSDGYQAENTRPITSHEDDMAIDIGRWTCYKFCFGTEYTNTPQFTNFTTALADYDIDVRTSFEYKVEDTTTSPLNKLLLHPLLSSSAKVSRSEDLFASHIHFSFPVRYQFEACLSNGYLRENNITAEFCEKLATLDAHDAVDILEKVYDQQQTFFDPMEIFRYQRYRRTRKRVPEYCVLQRSIVITPTMIYVASPQVEVSNRITRKHAADADRFIRVKFSDEKNEGPLRNMPNGRAEALFNRVRRALKHGIIVAGRTYYFLAFGNSQLREHGAYFYAPTATKSAQGIRNSLGQFDHIKTVAKFGARLGQCFSTTRAVGIKAKVVPIPDIERNGYCFTDGVGRISPFLAQMAAQELGLPDPFNNPPSLYQFRLGGCKGVLVLDPSLSNTEAHIRPSQQKFEADSTRLEIIRSSAFAIPFLNRQIIIVLSALGVPNEVFLRKQESMLDDFETAMTNESVAIAKLRTQVDMNQTTLTMAGMVADGFMQHGEPFLMSLLMLWRATGLKSLKERARIVIEKGAFVFGCVDETATLKGHNSMIQSNHNSTREEKLATLPEIFIQVDDTERKGHYKIIEGICILARNPSLHPGDVRIARAINVPSLQHLKNVVVLPQTGDRDLANMCSGGDLDGDDYMVLWDSDLLPKLVNELPMDYTPEKPVEKVGAITADDIGEFLVTYMENDSLGQIAHAHLAHADFDAEGVRSECCLELADLHSRAVDYPKSGIPAKMDPGLRPSKWPHFMEKKHVHSSKIYKSRKVLGLLYDQVQLVEFVPHWRNAFDERILKAYQLDSNVIQKAKDIKLLYDEALTRIMARYGIQTEFEAWSTFVLQHNNEIRDYKFAEELGRIIATLKSSFRSTCLKAAQVTDRTEWSRFGPFVAAMYTVTACEMDSFRSDEVKIPMISFPWLFASELGKIANANS